MKIIILFSLFLVGIAEARLCQIVDKKTSTVLFEYKQDTCAVKHFGGRYGDSSEVTHVENAAKEASDQAAADLAATKESDEITKQKQRIQRLKNADAAVDASSLSTELKDALKDVIKATIRLSRD